MTGCNIGFNKYCYGVALVMARGGVDNFAIAFSIFTPVAIYIEMVEVGLIISCQRLTVILSPRHDG
ncbi:MAG: hypothetical protein WBA93_03560 [Microcoleaceae cyanobacterium]